MFLTYRFSLSTAEYSAPLQFTQEPSDVQFSSKTSAYLHCVAMATSSYASNNQITITWRFENGSLVRNISDIVQTLPNGTLWFKPFNRLVPAVHRTKYQCVANLTLHNQAILSRLALVHGGRFFIHFCFRPLKKKGSDLQFSVILDRNYHRSVARTVVDHMTNKLRMRATWLASRETLGFVQNPRRWTKLENVVDESQIITWWSEDGSIPARHTALSWIYILDILLHTFLPLSNWT